MQNLHIIEIKAYIKKHYQDENTHFYHKLSKSMSSIETVDSTLNESVSNYIEAHQESSFQQLLFNYIDASAKSDVEIYKQAGIDRRLFSKIRSNQQYTPSKNTIIALGLALELKLEDAQALLDTCGYVLSCSSKFDLVIQYSFENKIYDYMDVNLILHELKENLLKN